MSSSSTKKVKPESDGDNLNESFPSYSFEIISDIFLGIVLGVLVNTVSSLLALKLNWSKFTLVTFQFALITIILYIMKIDSKYLYSSWKGHTSYGIMFTTVFLAVQKNVIIFFEDVYKSAEKKLGIPQGLSQPRSAQ